MTTDLSIPITTAELASLVCLTSRRVRQLAEAGHLPQAQSGRFSLIAGVQGYVGFLRAEDRRASQSAAASRVQDARAREIELRIAREDGQLIELAEHDAIFDEAFGILRARLSGVPAECSRDITIRDLIDDKIAGALTACCEAFRRMSEPQTPG